MRRVPRPTSTTANTTGGRPRRRRLTAGVAGAAALLAVGTGGCTGDDPDPPPPVASGVGVRTSGCGLADRIGSGVVVAPRTVVTVAHTVAGASEVTVVDRFGTGHAATPIAFDPNRDLAVLRADGLAAPSLGVASGRPGPATVMSWGPDAGVVVGDAEITRLLAITIEDIYVSDIVERSGLEVRADIEIGDSGGPVLDPSGNVVGIVYARSRARPGVGFAVDRTEIDAVLAAATEERADVGPCP